MVQPKNSEPSPENATTVQDVVPPTDPVPAQEDSHTPPTHDNEAVHNDPTFDESQPHEHTRPETKAERRDRRYGSNE